MDLLLWRHAEAVEGLPDFNVFYTCGDIEIISL